MLTDICINNFKCFKHAKIPFKPLTLLTGTNSSGKSSVLQAVLLAYVFNRSHNTFPYLNAILSPFMVFEDIYNKFLTDKSVSISANNGEEIFTLSQEGIIESKKTNNNVIYEDNAFYLSANRLGPEELSDVHNDLRIGSDGQYALGWLHKQKDAQVHPQLINEGIEPHQISHKIVSNISWWLAYITGTNISSNTAEVTRNKVKTSFLLPDIGELSPFNVGAGNSYLLKLLIMCLTAKPGDLLLIENPEIHLHPGAQSRLGEFLVFIAAREIQVIAETHCEHLINRVRYEVYEKKISAENVIIHYKPDSLTDFHTIFIKQTGHFCKADKSVINFPSGFFDSTLSELIRMG